MLTEKKRKSAEIPLCIFYFLSNALKRRNIWIALLPKQKKKKTNKKMGIPNHFLSFFFIGHKQTHPACYLSNYVLLRAVKGNRKVQSDLL